MLWSSWNASGYGVGVARSDNGSIAGWWSHDPEADIERGGHGMLFGDFDGQLRYALHHPNTFYKEHPYFATVALTNNSVIIEAPSS